jgi:hypothetical protein
MSKVKNWCFTAFKNIEQYKDINTIIQRDTKNTIKYIIYQGEYTKDKIQHIQGYIQMKDRKEMTAIKKLLDDKTIHLEPSKGTPQEASNYCKKTEKDGEPQDIFLEYQEYGELDITISGTRTDLIGLKDKLINGETLTNIMMNTIDNTELRNCLHYNRPLRELQHNIQQKTQREKVLEKYEDIEWNKLQKHLISIIDTEKEIDETRKIHWIYDEYGNNGKTHLAKYLVANGDTYYITGGKQADILYSYEGQSIIIYDLARTYADNLDHIYTTIENLKNGFYLSTKYNSEQRIYSKQPTILILANFKPDTSKLSKDRWNIIDTDDYIEEYIPKTDKELIPKKKIHNVI